MDLVDPLTTVYVGLLVLRVLVGVTFSLHGMQKLLGWFGGGGLSGTSGWSRDRMYWASPESSSTSPSKYSRARSV